jgi:hypothetical protein
MLRSLGIPARMAVGFSQGQFDTQTGFYHVRERNAHAWPEVYFPDYGWVEFEPTGNEPPLLRPDRTIVSETNDDVPELAAIPTQTFNDDEPPAPQDATNTPAIDWAVITRWASNAGVVLAVLSALALGLVLLLLRFNLLGLESLGRPGQQLLNWMGRAVPSAVTRAYVELERAARWLGLRLPDHLTPHERASALNGALPETQTAVDTITTHYVHEQYSPHPDTAHGPTTLDAWRNIRTTVWREGVRRFFRRWLEDDWSRAMRAAQNGDRAETHTYADFSRDPWNGSLNGRENGHRSRDGANKN